MKERISRSEKPTRAERNAVDYHPASLERMPEKRGLWYETPEEVAAGLAWGQRKAELLRWVRRQMGRRLTERERRCIELYFFEGLDYRGVASQSGLSVSSAHRNVKRALRKLRQAARQVRQGP